MPVALDLACTSCVHESLWILPAYRRVTLALPHDVANSRDQSLCIFKRSHPH